MMERTPKLSASIMCANLMNLGKDVHTLHKKGFDFLHFDIMDGHFVPQIGLGTFFLRQLCLNQPVPVDVHLMVTDPENYIDELCEAGASVITFHYETGKDVYHILQMIKRRSVRAGIALRPFTPISLLTPLVEFIDLILLMAYSPGMLNQEPVPHFEDQIRELTSFLESHGKNHIDIAVDGGISEQNLSQYRDAGANFFVFGSSGLFIPGKGLEKQIDRLKSILFEYEQESV